MEEEEAKLVDILNIMVSYSYGYTRQEVAVIVSDYAVHLQKRTKDFPYAGVEES